MAFLHCHSCDWSQDDFWDETYNPMRWLLTWEKELLTKDLDSAWTDDKNAIAETGCKTWREILAKQLENGASRIQEMLFRTAEDFYANKHRPCPKCGDVNWDID